MLYLSLRLRPDRAHSPWPGRKPRQTHSPYARCTLQRVESGCQTARIRRIEAPSDTPAPVRGSLPSHGKRPGLISRTLEGCRRGRSGVRPLRQPVATRLLKISQKMNPKHFGGKSGTLRRRTPFLRLPILPKRHPSTRPINAASTANNGATFPSSAVRQPSSASIRWSVDSAVDFRASTMI